MHRSAAGSLPWPAAAAEVIAEFSLFPAVANIALIPFGANGVNLPGCMKNNPPIIYIVNSISNPITSIVCVFPVCFTPNRFIDANNKQKEIAIIFRCISVSSEQNTNANAPIPIRANAVFAVNENHDANPPIVPAVGPRLLSIKK